MTQCNTKTRVHFHPDKPVDLEFDAPDLSTDGGAVLLRQVDEHLDLCETLAEFLPDDRDPTKVQHSRLEQVRQRVFQIAMGWEDQNDADCLREDPVYKMVAGRQPDDEPLSSQPTLSLFENSVGMRTNKKLLETLELDWIDRLDEDREVVVLDVDASGYEGYGQQELLAYDGFHGAHIHHPLFVMDAQTKQVVSAVLRPGDVGDARGVVGLLRRIIDRLKVIRPDIEVVVRGDAGFARPNLYRMLEEKNRKWGGVGYVIGIAKNSAFERKLEESLDGARAKFERSGDKQRTFQWFDHQAQSWETSRSIVGKAEVGPQGDNPRFVVTNIDEFSPRLIYVRAYCPRGDAENTVKSIKTHLKSDRMSLESFEANFFRLLQHVIAHRLLMGLQEVCSEEAKRRRTIRRKVEPDDQEEDDEQEVIDQLERLAGSQLDTLRLLVLKVAALVNQAVRRLTVELPRSFPMAGAYGALASRLDGY